MLSAQNFEGKLTYKLEYQLDSVTLKKFNFSYVNKVMTFSEVSLVLIK